MTTGFVPSTRMILAVQFHIQLWLMNLAGNAALLGGVDDAALADPEEMAAVGLELYLSSRRSATSCLTFSPTYSVVVPLAWTRSSEYRPTGSPTRLGTRDDVKVRRGEKE